MDLQIPQILSQIIAFVIMVWVLNRYAWKPLLSILDERKERIAKEFSQIEESKQSLEDLKKEYEKNLKQIHAQSEEKFQKEVEKARRYGEELKSQAKKDSEELMQRALEETALEISKAKSELKVEIADLVVKTAEKVLQENLKDPSSQKNQVLRRLEEAKF